MKLYHGERTMALRWWWSYLSRKLGDDGLAYYILHDRKLPNGAKMEGEE